MGWGLRFRVQGSGFREREKSLGFKVRNLGFKV